MLHNECQIQKRYQNTDCRFVCSKINKTFNEFQQFTLKLGIEFVPTAEYHLKKQQERQLWEDGGMNTKESEWLALPDAVLQCSIVIRARFPLVQSKRRWDNDWLRGLKAILLCCGTQLRLLLVFFIYFVVQLCHWDMHYKHVCSSRKHGWNYTTHISQIQIILLTRFSVM